MSRAKRFERWVCTTTAGFLFATVCLPAVMLIGVFGLVAGFEAFR